MINVPLGQLKFADGLEFSFPTSMCCNCGTTSGLSVLRQDTRQTTYLGVGGTEITFQLPLPFCTTCARSAKRRVKSLIDRLLMFALMFGATFLGLIILGEVYSLPQLSEYLITLSAVVATALTVTLVLVARPKGNQTSYYQPVRISKLKREFISGKVVGIRFRFSNNDYAQLFSSHNQEPIRSKLVEVEQ